MFKEERVQLIVNTHLTRLIQREEKEERRQRKYQAFEATLLPNRREEISSGLPPGEHMHRIPVRTATFVAGVRGSQHQV